MKRDVKAYLFDIQEAARQILSFTGGMSLPDYQDSELVKAAVERKFSVIGEALVRLREEYPEVLADISDAEKVVGFRNVLVHGYDIVDDATVWSAVQSNLPVLLEEVKTLADA